MPPTTGPPDPAAVAIAQAAHRAVRHSAIILFGSRAAGTHRPDSDVDIMLVYPKSRNCSDLVGRIGRKLPKEQRWTVLRLC